MNLQLDEAYIAPPSFDAPLPVKLQYETVPRTILSSKYIAPPYLQQSLLFFGVLRFLQPADGLGGRHAYAFLVGARRLVGSMGMRSAAVGTHIVHPGPIVVGEGRVAVAVMRKGPFEAVAARVFLSGRVVSRRAHVEQLILAVGIVFAAREDHGAARAHFAADINTGASQSARRAQAHRQDQDQPDQSLCILHTPHILSLGMRTVYRPKYSPVKHKYAYVQDKNNKLYSIVHIYT